MPQRPDIPSHPGAFVREHVIPSGMSVTDAAKKLGVGRPALSNMLNGRSSLSPKMAARLRKAFGADGRELLDLQAAFDRHARREEEKLIAVRPHVPDFLTVTARDIDRWAEGKAARDRLPVLLRKLIHSTGLDLRHVDFPGYDNAERPGWDGWVETDAATPWIPEGKSGWEFGVGKEPRRKAEHDYVARLRSVPPDERAECAFVFVTPRNWPSKTGWAKGKAATDGWKEVRAFDASDLEQWLEVSVPARLWLAEELGLPVDGFETLDACWRRWAEASEPALNPAIFAPSLSAYRGAFGDWLGKPPDRPFTVAADSTDEALAFLTCLFKEDGADARWQDLAAVFDSVEALRKLAASNAPFLPVVHTDEVERELAAVYRQRHCIAVRPRNAVKPDIALELLDHGAFREALVDMGIDESDIDRLARESGRSPTILRRRLSEIPAVRKPEWAADDGIARALIPMALVGAWRGDFDADREVVSFWGGEGYARIEENTARFLQFDDCPIWSVGRYRGVASKIDALFAIAEYVTEQDLRNFFFLVEHVLSKNDPALELPESRRRAAGLYEKVRDRSPALREGICDTLVLLSVHGNDLFRHRLGIDVKAWVSQTIHNLLTPLTLEKLLSHNDDLPRYAEAAPEEFLKLIEADLRQSDPAVLGLLKPAEGGVFGRYLISGLLWALECLAWKHLGRVSSILARLSETPINDGLTNKPITSLEEIYRSWLPQTAASLEERMQSLESLVMRFPDIGWRICVAQLDARMPQMAHPTYRPRWRSDASGVGRAPLPAMEIHQYMRKALDLVLAWPKHDHNTLGDLVELVGEMPDEDRCRVWDLIDRWATSDADDKARANLRDRIRRFAFVNSGQRFLNGETRHRVAYAKLEPADLVVRHAWLFADGGIEFSVDETEEFDMKKREREIRQLRDKAMTEIWEARGFEGVAALFAFGGLPDTAGVSLTSAIENPADRIDFLLKCLSISGDLEKRMDSCLQGFMRSLGDDAREALIVSTAAQANTDRIVRLVRTAPFRQGTWRLLDRFSAEIRDRYWRKIAPEWDLHGEAELAELIDRLVAAKRPRAAFGAALWNWSRIETSRLKRLLFEAGAVDAEQRERYRLDPYRISEALDALAGRTGVTLEEMVQLEIMYIDALKFGKHDIRNTERRIAESPMFFVQMLAGGFERNDSGEDPPEWRIEDPERRRRIALTAHSVLHRIRRVPGVGEDEKIDTGKLFAWVTEARQLCAEYGRTRIGDRCIGEILSKGPADEDGYWPCLPVCEVMQTIASPDIDQAFELEVRNSRGATMRAMGEGGAQERTLADKYRNWARQRAFSYPRVGGILESIAEYYDRDAVRADNNAEIRARIED